MTALDSGYDSTKGCYATEIFDIADIEYFTVKKIWGSGNLQPFDVSKLKYYDKIVGIFKSGKPTQPLRSRKVLLLHGRFCEIT